MQGRALLTTAEVASLLRVHPKHVYRLLKQGLPARRVGGEWRFAPEEVLAWSAGSAPATPSAVAPLLAANGDVIVEILLRQLAGARTPLIGLLRADRSAALAHLGARRVLLAGHHGGPAPGRLDPGGAHARVARVHLVRREVGVAFAPRHRLRRVTDLARKRLASRPPTAGIRTHFDDALRRDGSSLADLRVRVFEAASHVDAVCAILRGDADAALTTAAWAARAGLPFLPLADETYELLVHAEDLANPGVVGVCEVAQSKVFARAARDAGYEPKGAGEIRIVGDP